MSNNELYSVRGGAVVSFSSASWLNALSRTVNTLYNIGKSIGSSLRCLIKKK